MIQVQCPSCSAPYDLDERRLPASGLRMRCPKCGASFHVGRDGTVGEAPAAAPKPPAPPPPAPPPPTGLAARVDDLDLPAPRRPVAPDFPGVADLPAPRRAPIAPPVAPPVAARPPAPPARKPIAPDFDGDDLDLDLPALKAAKTADDGLDLPAPKAPDLELDLPAPKMPPKAAPDLGLDLPAPKAARPAPDLGLDLPAPKAKPAPDLGLDLPAPKGPPKAARPAPDLGLDLPAPKAKPAPDLGLDLPAPKGTTDLPAPKRPIAPAFVPDVEPPAPARGSTPFDDMVDDLDLPMPKGADNLDLPALKGGGDFDLDLPMPKGAGELDLPAPKAGGLDLDLPAPKGFDLDLPTPKAGGLDLDLPTPRNDLPAPKGGGGFDLELPSPKDDFGSLDLGGGLDLDLPAPRNDLPAPGPGRGGITDLPAPRNDLPAPASGLDDDLALPEPRARAEVPKGAGGAGFGEIDLGGGGDGLEFADLPQEEAPRISSPGKDVPKAAASERKAKSKREKSTAAPKKKGRGLLVFVAVLLLIAGAGVALQWTPYGIFGVYALEQFRPEAGDDAGITRTLADAEALASSDTYADVRASLRQLGTARRELYLNRRLLARSVVHEALFQLRFGESPRSAARENALLQRLEIRGNDAPGMSLALAAHAVRAGRMNEVPAHLSAARSEAPSDPYVSLVAGEHALASGQPAAALEAFGAGGEGARALWGVARAHLATPDADAAAVDAAIAAVLEASPDHASALVARARRAFAGGDEASALRDASLAAGAETPVAGAETPDGREPILASDRERADAWTLLGQIHEARGRRGPAGVAYEKAVEADPFRVEALLGAGRVLLVERRFREALARFESAQESSQGLPPPAEGHPFDVQAKLGQVEALLPLEQHQQALGIAAALAQQLPADPIAALWHGRALGALDQDDAAKAELDRAIELAPDSFEGYLALAQLHFANDDAASAAEVLIRARERVPESAQMRRLLGDSELRRGNLDAAERELRAALVLEADQPETLFLLATTLRRARRLQEAERTLEQLAAIDGAYPGLSLERGRLFEAMGQASRAADAYARALAESPEDLDLELRLGAAQLAAGRLEDAEPHLQNVLRQRPDSAEAEHFVGRLYRAKGDGPTAIQHLTRAADLDPQIAEYHLHLGWAQLESNQLGAASDEIAAALEIDPQLPEAFHVRGLLGNRTGAVRDAKVDFERALALRPTLHEARAGLGDALDQLGDRPGAIRAYEAAVAADGTQADWWYRLGRVRFDAGRSGESVAALGRAIELGGATERRPSWLPDAHRIRGEAHRLGGNRAAAIADYRRYLEIAPASALDREDVQDRLFDLGAR